MARLDVIVSAPETVERRAPTRQKWKGKLPPMAGHGPSICRKMLSGASGEEGGETTSVWRSWGADRCASRPGAGGCGKSRKRWGSELDSAVCDDAPLDYFRSHLPAPPSPASSPHPRMTTEGPSIAFPRACCHATISLLFHCVVVPVLQKPRKMLGLAILEIARWGPADDWSLDRLEAAPLVRPCSGGRTGTAVASTAGNY
ncbi:hypothetical protein B0T25DRAFT_229417 [Lasiosphaeria hispida]|uniref:Uncharacterized protein n=1 Tax=Lasiosphaeria hispida TaxID=260671 RepID=A0AAJ0HDG3_9PEZI|nr:hypothetical protein B0T25DRAFT_229417 [Lasiosphaeria hispida]